jgi:hypothetical protein
VGEADLLMPDVFEPLPFPESAWDVPWIPFGLADDEWLSPCGVHPKERDDAA